MYKAQMYRLGDGLGDGVIGGWSITFDPHVVLNDRKCGGITSTYNDCIQAAADVGILPAEIERIENPYR